MRRLYLYAVMLIFFISASALKADLGFGFNIGLATPNNSVNDVYNTSRIEEEDFLGNLYRDAAELGYQIGVKVRLPMSESAAITGGIAWTRFPETDIEVKDPETDEMLTTLGSNQNVIPISAGINYYLFNADIGVYGTGELTYNLISSSVDYKSGDLNIPIDTSPTDSRVGFGVGAGIDLDIPALFTVNIEGRYNFINLIGKEENEKTKSYATLTVGIYFGGNEEDQINCLTNPKLFPLKALFLSV